MDKDANYVAVGAFVLLVVMMAAVFVFWYSGQQDKATYRRYEVYFEGSVSGLSAGSPVRYLGVDVGKVVRIALDPKARTRVQVIADVDAKAPLDAGTRASLSLQGVTGLLYIDLEQDPKAAGGSLPEGESYPIIGSGHSSIDLLLASLPGLADRMVELTGRLNQVLSDDNISSFNAAVRNAKQASDQLPAALRDADQLMLDARHTTQEIQSGAADLRGVIDKSAPDLESAVGNLRHAADSLAHTSEQLDHFMADNEPGLSSFTRQGLPELEQLLRDSRQAARDFTALSRSLKANPSQLIYEPNYRGVQVPP